MRKKISITILISLISIGTIFAADMKQNSSSLYSEQKIDNQVVELTKYIDTTYEMSVKKINEKDIIWTYDEITKRKKMLYKNDLFKVVSNGFVTLYKTNGEVSTYYLDEEGNRITQWVHTIDNNWYYFSEEKTTEGEMKKKGWEYINGKYYYFTADGKLLMNSVTPDRFLVNYNGERQESTEKIERKKMAFD